ncbi:hypothetical protein RSAG8_10413, partial [Rhizoctonia solani AG-8 WAC10335]
MPQNLSTCELALYDGLRDMSTLSADDARHAERDDGTYGP